MSYANYSLVITSGQSSLTRDCIAPTHKSFNRLQPENVSFGFTIRRIKHHYCLCVLFLGMCCDWLTRHAHALGSHLQWRISVHVFENLYF